MNKRSKNGKAGLGSSHGTPRGISLKRKNKCVNISKTPLNLVCGTNVSTEEVPEMAKLSVVGKV